MPSPTMIVKCNKTGKILFSTEEAQKHAEQIGSPDFTEIDPNSMITVDAETRRRVFHGGAEEVLRYKQRTRQPEFQTVEITVTEYQKILTEHELKHMNDAKVVNYAKKKIIDALVEVKGYGIIRSEKACWYTQNKGVPEAEAWIAANKDDPDIDKPLRLPKDEEAPTSPKEAKEGDAMEVDQEGETGEVATENGLWLREKCNPKLLEEMLGMGFSKLRSEKALYHTDNVSVEHAVNWITEHQEDDDIDKPITKEPAKKPELSKEEAQKAALELQQKIKQEREEREKQEAKDKEKARIESAKLMLDTQAQLMEEQRKRDIEALKREKAQHEEHKQQLKEQMRLDYIERFGHEPPAEEEQAKDDIKSKPSKQQVTFWLQNLKKEHLEKNPAGLKVCLNTMKLYMNNARNNPEEKKYHKIKKENKAFQERVAPFPEALELLRVCGFKDDADPGFMEIANQVDGWLIGEALKFIDLVLNKL